MVFSLLALSWCEMTRENSSGSGGLATTYHHKDLCEIFAESGNNQIEKNDLAEDLPRPVQQGPKHAVSLSDRRIGVIAHQRPHYGPGGSCEGRVLAVVDADDEEVGDAVAYDGDDDDDDGDDDDDDDDDDD